MHGRSEYTARNFCSRAHRCLKRAIFLLRMLKAALLCLAIAQLALLASSIPVEVDTESLTERERNVIEGIARKGKVSYFFIKVSCTLALRKPVLEQLSLLWMKISPKWVTIPQIVKYCMFNELF